MTSSLSSSIQAVIFDWAGTLVDFGSLAPTQIFVEAFESFGVHISLEQARGPMGLSKREHIRQLLAEPDVRQQWRNHFARMPNEQDVEALYERFMPMQIAKVGEYSQPIPGAVNTLKWLRQQGIKIGSCSGYPGVVMDVLRPLAQQAGIAPDYVVAGDELEAGARPGGFMALANVLALKVDDVRSCVKVDDTAPGIEEGRNAGMWSVGLSLSGNEVGYPLEELDKVDPAQLAGRTAQAEEKLRKAGAHYVIPTIADLPAVLEDIAARRERGETP